MGIPCTHHQFSTNTQGSQTGRGSDIEVHNFLPYVSGLSEDVRRVGPKFDIRKVFTTISTLRQQLTRVKDVDPPLRKAGVIYKEKPREHWEDA